MTAPRASKADQRIDAACNRFVSAAAAGHRLYAVDAYLRALDLGCATARHRDVLLRWVRVELDKTESESPS